MKKAESILSGDDPDNVLTGPKENSFYHNLLLNGMYITVDSHIFASVISIDHWKCGFASQTQESDKSVVNAYLSVAKSLGIEGYELQGINWLVTRRIKTKGL